MVIKKIVAIVLSLCVLTGIFAGCASSSLSNTEYAVTFADGEKDLKDKDGNVIATSAQLAKVYKLYAQYLRDFYENYVKTVYAVTDFNAYLTQSADSSGKTVEDYLIQQTQSAFTEYLVIKKQMKDLGLSFTDEEKQTYEETYASQGISEEQTKEICKTIGISEEEYKDCLIYVPNGYTHFIDYFYGAGGEEEISEETIRNSYNENYRRFKCILLLKTDASGNTLTTNELTTKQQKADSILQQVNAGASFEDFIKSDSEAYTDPSTVTDEETLESVNAANDMLLNTGYIIDSNGYLDSVSQIDTSVTEQVFSMNVGESAMIETTTAFWVVKLYDLNESEDLYNEKRDEVFYSLASPKYSAKYTQWEQDMSITLNEEFTNTVKPSALTTLFYSDTSSDTNQVAEKQTTGLSVAQIVIIGACAFVVLVAVLVILMIVLSNRNKKKETEPLVSTDASANVVVEHSDLGDLPESSTEESTSVIDINSINSDQTSTDDEEYKPVFGETSEDSSKTDNDSSTNQ